MHFTADMPLDDLVKFVVAHIVLVSNPNVPVCGLPFVSPACGTKQSLDPSLAKSRRASQFLPQKRSVPCVPRYSQHPLSHGFPSQTANLHRLAGARAEGAIRGSACKNQRPEFCGKHIPTTLQFPRRFFSAVSEANLETRYLVAMPPASFTPLNPDACTIYVWPVHIYSRLH
mmetsp:Transcript_17742/g.30554  ORF Transcript_17742/g.30554 Transcript_17742/m.30554 type:complete len:172 (+) Transcript_17742:857-1372(+)